jgi:hypothetical protein
MNLFKTLAMVGLVGVGMVYGESTNSSADQENDAIKAVVASLNPIFWEEGLFQPVKLPSDTPIEEVCFKALNASKGDLIFKKIRPVNVYGQVCTGVYLYQRDISDLVLLLKYEGEKVGWWHREYKIPNSDQ